jgi:hypothetical protein
VSRRYQSILIGGLIGGIIGVMIGWVYSEFTEEHTTLPVTGSAAANLGLKFRADGGDLLKLGIAVIPVVRMLTKMFVPVDQGRTPPKSQRKA